MTFRWVAPAPAIATMRTTGTVRYPQSAVEGRFTSSSADDDRLRVDIDLDRSVQVRTVLNKGRAWYEMTGAASIELTGKALAQTRLGHPSVLFGDWRKYYDAVRVIREGVLGGRKVVPHRSIASTDVAGRTIFQVERVEVNVELPPGTFTLGPFNSPGPGR